MQNADPDWIEAIVRIACGLVVGAIIGFCVTVALDFKTIYHTSLLSFTVAVVFATLSLIWGNEFWEWFIHNVWRHLY